MRTYSDQQPLMSIGYHQEYHWAIRWLGSWRRESDPGASLKGYAIGAEAGDAIEVVFDGTRLDLVTVKGPNMGRLLYSIDGSLDRELDLHGDQREYQTHLNLVDGLSDAPHTLRISVVEGPVVIDALLVRRLKPSPLSYLIPIVLGLALASAWLVVRWFRGTSL
jgi:hypothetical protein